MDIVIKMPHGYSGVATSFDNFVKNGRVDTIEIDTFGIFIGPITRTESGELVGRVVCWANGKITISVVEDSESILLEVVDWENKAELTSDERLGLFDNAFNNRIKQCQEKTLGYLAWHSDAQKRAYRGEEQSFCANCKRFKWGDNVCDCYYC